MLKTTQPKIEEPIKIQVEVKPKTSDEIYAERLARAMVFRQIMNNTEKDLKMKSQMQTVKRALELSRHFKKQDLNARLAAEAKKLNDWKKLTKQLENMVKGFTKILKNKNIVKEETNELEKWEEFAKHSFQALLTPKKEPVKIAKLSNYNFESKLAIALQKEIARRENYRQDTISYFAKKNTWWIYPV